MSFVETRCVAGVPRIAVDVAGHGPGLPVVLLHGIGGNRSNWREDLPAIARGRQVLALDARGYGDSDDYDGDVTVQTLGADVLRVLDAFSLERAVLVGLSLGASVALETAMLAPERTPGLVLIAAAPLLSESLSEAQRQAFIASRQAPLLEGASLEDIAPTVAASLMGPAADAAVRERLEASIAALHRDAYLKTIAASFRYAPTQPLETIACPTLVLHGTADPLVPPSVAQATAAAIPGARLRLLEGVGHLLNFEAPEAFRDALNQFLTALEAGGSSRR